MYVVLFVVLGPGLSKPLGKQGSQGSVIIIHAGCEQFQQFFLSPAATVLCVSRNPLTDAHPASISTSSSLSIQLLCQISQASIN